MKWTLSPSNILHVLLLLHVLFILGTKMITHVHSDNGVIERYTKQSLLLWAAISQCRSCQPNGMTCPTPIRREKFGHCNVSISICASSAECREAQ